LCGPPAPPGGAGNEATASGRGDRFPSPPGAACPQGTRPQGTRVTVAPLLATIGWIESRDDDRAVGDNGTSRGRFQIRLAYWSDAIAHALAIGAITHEAVAAGEWDYLRRVWSRPHCEAVIHWYWDRYAPRALRALESGRGPAWLSAAEVLARVHNGGPRGHRKTATLRYWRDVRKELLR